MAQAWSYKLDKVLHCADAVLERFEVLLELLVLKQGVVYCGSATRP